MGKPAPRIDGAAKVTGAAKYAYDVQPEGWLYGMILRSKLPAANVTRIDLSKAQSMPGVKAVIQTGASTVRFYGQELAAVAATTGSSKASTRWLSVCPSGISRAPDDIQFDTSA